MFFNSCSYFFDRRLILFCDVYHNIDKEIKRLK